MKSINKIGDNYKSNPMDLIKAVVALIVCLVCAMVCMIGAETGNGIQFFGGILGALFSGMYCKSKVEEDDRRRKGEEL